MVLEKKRIKYNLKYLNQIYQIYFKIFIAKAQSLKTNLSIEKRFQLKQMQLEQN